MLWLLHHYKCCPRGLISSAGPPLIGQHPPILVSDWFQQSLTSVQMLSLQIRSSLLGVLSQQRLVCFALWWHRQWPIRGRDGIETPDETIVSIRLEVFWINYLSTYGLPSIFWIFIVPTLFLPTKSCLISKKIVKTISIIWHLILDLIMSQH